MKPYRLIIIALLLVLISTLFYGCVPSINEGVVEGAVEHNPDLIHLSSGTEGDILVNATSFYVDVYLNRIDSQTAELVSVDLRYENPNLPVCLFGGSAWIRVFSEGQTLWQNPNKADVAFSKVISALDNKNFSIPPAHKMILKRGDARIEVDYMTLIVDLVDVKGEKVCPVMPDPIRDFEEGLLKFEDPSVLAGWEPEQVATGTMVLKLPPGLPYDPPTITPTPQSSTENSGVSSDSGANPPSNSGGSGSSANPPSGAPFLQNPANGSVLAEDTEVVLAWQPVSGATQYKVELWGGQYTGTMVPCDWQAETSCRIGRMWPGNVSWRVKARNASGEGNWSSSASFTIGNAPAPTGAVRENTATPAPIADCQITSYTTNAERVTAGTQVIINAASNCDMLRLRVEGSDVGGEANGPNASFTWNTDGLAAQSYSVCVVGIRNGQQWQWGSPHWCGYVDVKSNAPEPTRPPDPPADCQVTSYSVSAERVTTGTLVTVNASSTCDRLRLRVEGDYVDDEVYASSASFNWDTTGKPVQSYSVCVMGIRNDQEWQWGSPHWCSYVDIRNP